MVHSIMRHHLRKTSTFCQPFKIAPIHIPASVIARRCLSSFPQHSRENTFSGTSFAAGALFSVFATSIGMYTWMQERIENDIHKEVEDQLQEHIKFVKDNREDPLLCKIKGVFYGKAVGDTLGVFTEFLTEPQARAYRRPRLEFSDRSAFSRLHLDRFPKNGPTDDTDQALLIIHSEKEYLSDPSTPKEAYFAQQLMNWRQNGLNGYSSVAGLAFETREDPKSSDPQRAHISCQGLGWQTSQVLNHRLFLQNPHQAALDIWKQHKNPIAHRPAANGASMRTALLGVIYRGNITDTVKEAVRYAKVTHADPRSIASAVAITCAINLLLNNHSLSDVLTLAQQQASAVLRAEIQALRPHLIPSEQEKARFDAIVDTFDQELRTSMQADLPALDLDEPERIGYTFKCLGAAFYALRKAEALCRENPQKAKSSIYREVIQEIIWEAGDADTNAAVAGALVGAYLGVEAIPDSWIFFLHRRDKIVLEQSIAHAQQVASRILGKP